MSREAKRNADIEKVYRVFEEDIKASPYLDWLWSDKLGYILTQINLERQEIVESRVISDAKKFCLLLFHELAQDILQREGKEHATYEADASEREKIERRLKPYIAQLPQYRCLYDKLFEE